MANPFYGRDIISTRDFTREELEYLFHAVDLLEALPLEGRMKLARGRVLGLFFYEPSTRTRLSFEAAMLSLGGGCVGFTDPRSASVEKGENLADTIRAVDGFVDILVLRHPTEGAARFAAEVSAKPIINAGSGSEEHPTQAMLDLYTIYKEFNRIDGLGVGVIGDLRYGRTVYSLLYALSRFQVRIHLISPPSLRIRREAFYDLEGRVPVEEHDSLDRIASSLDVLYVTRIQRERFPDLHEYEKVKGSYAVNGSVLEKAAKRMIILHPLPRLGEISPEVDASPHARYFQQAKNGKAVRAALLALILSRELA